MSNPATWNDVLTKYEELERRITDLEIKNEIQPYKNENFEEWLPRASEIMRRHIKETKS